MVLFPYFLWAARLAEIASQNKIYDKLNPGSKLRLKAWLWAARLAELASLKKN